MGAFLGGYPASDLTLTEEQKLWAPPFWSPVNGTLDGYLLDHWFQRRASYDALFVNSWANTSQAIYSELCSAQTCGTSLSAGMCSAHSRAHLRA